MLRRTAIAAVLTIFNQSLSAKMYEIKIYTKAFFDAHAAMKYSPDSIEWGVDDYWATPEETIANGYGDCEDFALLVNYFCAKQGMYDTQIMVCLVNGQPHVVSLLNHGQLVADVGRSFLSPLSERYDLQCLVIATIDAESIPQSKRPL